MGQENLTVALISDVFFDNDPAARLRARLVEARSRGAGLAVLPEIPVHPWSPATKAARDEDAEPPKGPRHQMQADAARAAGIALLGGVIVCDPASGRRFSRALLLNATGSLLGTFQKMHVPEEPGFWETSHYDAGDEPPQPIEGLSLPVGVQICSDINRPEGCHLLGAMGAEAILAPRATEQATYARWRHVFIANALTSCTYILSANRPRPEQGVLIGGPSIAVAPNGQVLLETTDPVALVTLERSVVEQCRVQYPGYLPILADAYARAWAEIARRGDRRLGGYAGTRRQ